MVRVWRIVTLSNTAVWPAVVEPLETKRPTFAVEGRLTVWVVPTCVHVLPLAEMKELTEVPERRRRAQ